jgi:hypothetical protein
MIKIPNETKSFLQHPTSDVLGNLCATSNIELADNRGRVRVSPRSFYVNNSDDLVNLTIIHEFEYYDGRLWGVSGGRVFRQSSTLGDLSTTWEQDATAGSPTGMGDYVSIKSFATTLYVLGNGTLYKYTGGVWSTVSTLPQVWYPSMCVFGNRLYFVHNYQIIGSMDFNEAVSVTSTVPNLTPYTFVLPYQQNNGSSFSDRVISMVSSSDKIWIASMGIDTTSNTSYNYSLIGRIYAWDGVNARYISEYSLENQGVVAMIIKDDIPYIMDLTGRLLKFNGSSFVPVRTTSGVEARLPIPKYNSVTGGTVQNGYQAYIHRNGMCIRDGKINVLVNANTQKDILLNENFHYGVWEFDEQVGFYHRLSPSIWKYNSTTTRNDFKQARSDEVGALINSHDFTSTITGDVLFSCKYLTTSSTSTGKYGIFITDTNDNKSKCGYITTTKIESQGIQDNWNKLYVKHKKLLDSSDKIVLKYRTSDSTPIEGAITWSSTTVFTSTVDLSTIVAGDEVEIISATGGGQIEHISSISVNAGTYTVTLENAVTGATGTSRARFQKWIKLGTINNQTKDIAEFALNIVSNWIQLKCVMYFTGRNELNELLLVNTPYKQAV